MKRTIIMMDYSKEFASLYNLIIEDLNECGDSNLGIHYSGFPYSGDLQSSDILILSVNPGFGEEWNTRHCMEPVAPPRENKYISELKEGATLATQLNDTLCAGNPDLFMKMVEAYIATPYATPNEEIYNDTFNSLSQEVWEKHRDLRDAMITNILNEMSPKLIICIGVNVYNQSVKLLRKIDGYQVESPSSWETKTNNNHYIDQSLKNGARMLGCKHLSHVKGDSWTEWFRERFEKSLSTVEFA
jgi:hypothetical protein